MTVYCDPVGFFQHLLNDNTDYFKGNRIVAIWIYRVSATHNYRIWGGIGLDLL